MHGLYPRVLPVELLVYVHILNCMCNGFLYGERSLSISCRMTSSWTGQRGCAHDHAGPWGRLPVIMHRYSTNGNFLLVKLDFPSSVPGPRYPEARSDPARGSSASGPSPGPESLQRTGSASLFYGLIVRAGQKSL